MPCRPASYPLLDSSILFLWFGDTFGLYIPHWFITLKTSTQHSFIPIRSTSPAFIRSFRTLHISLRVVFRVGGSLSFILSSSEERLRSNRKHQCWC
nr:hypothetical protein Q903MT_gene1512 [Picea sitchensis]